MIAAWGGHGCFPEVITSNPRITTAQREPSLSPAWDDDRPNGKGAPLPVSEEEMTSSTEHTVPDLESCHKQSPQHRPGLHSRERLPKLQISDPRGRGRATRLRSPRDQVAHGRVGGGRI